MTQLLDANGRPIRGSGASSTYVSTEEEKARAAGKIVPTVNYRTARDEKLGIVCTREFFIFDQLISKGNPSDIAQLPHDIAAHALWYYFTIARHSYERAEKNLVYEGQPDVQFNARQLFTSIAGVYGVSPKEMGKYWPVVDRQRFALGLSANADLPSKFKFRE